MKTRPMPFVVAAAVIALAGAAGPRPMLAQEALPYCAEQGVRWGVGPTLASAPGGDKLALRGSVSGCRTGHVQLVPVDSAGLKDGWPASYMLRVESNVLVAESSLRVPDANTLRVSGGWSVSFSRPPLKAPLDWPIDSLESWDGGGYNRGFLDVGGAVGYETSADWDEHNLVAGLQLGYALNASTWGRLLPSVTAHVDVVKPTVSAARTGAGLPKDAYGRLGARAYWNTGLDFLARDLEYLRLQADLALYRTFGLDQALVDQGWNAGEYGTVSLRYVRSHTLVGPIGVESVYVRYAIGEWPTRPEEADAFTAGVLFRIGR